MKEDISVELRTLIAPLDAELEAIETAHPRSLEAEPTPDRIYYYTDDTGLRGIIELSGISASETD